MIETLEDLAALLAGKIDGLETRLCARLDAIETRVEGAEFSAESARVRAGLAADSGVEIVTKLDRVLERLERIESLPGVASRLRLLGGRRHG